MKPAGKYAVLVVVRRPSLLAAGLLLGGIGVLCLAVKLQTSLDDVAWLGWTLRYGVTSYACTLISAALQVVLMPVEEGAA